LNALVFLYQQVMKVDPGDFGDVVRARKPKRLPVVMSRDEAKAVLENLHGEEWLMANLLYGSGLRLMECLRLRVKDLDFSRGEVVVREGKGDKDRRSMLPQNLVEPLTKHLLKVKAINDDDLKQFTSHFSGLECSLSLEPIKVRHDFLDQHTRVGMLLYVPVNPTPL